VAEARGRLADQLQVALDHRILIEQAKGVLMGRDHIDSATAFERLRAQARSSGRKVAEIARELLATVPEWQGRR
jgi:AmiR/NasT family two-component response regulator